MAKPDLATLIARQMAPAGEPRSIETITQEILSCKVRAGESILQIGRCLNEAKEMLPHGEWLPWLNEQVDLSERTAQKFMRLAREWANPNTLADLGASKALILLALPEEERDSFVEEHNVIDMSARQLEQAIRERDEARVAAEHAAAEQQVAEQARSRMEEDVKFLNVCLARAKEDREQAMQDVVRLEAELADLKARPVEVAVETMVDQDAIDKARADAIAEMQDKLDKASEAKRQAEEREREAQVALEEANRLLDEQARAQHVAGLTADKDVAQFELLYTQAQEQASKLRGLLLQVRGRDQETGDKLSQAILALAEAIRGCAI